MGRKWLCRILDVELGPLSFSDLVEMIQTETLSEDDLVRGAGESEWIHARDVVGLFATARIRVKKEEAAEPKIRSRRQPGPEVAREPKRTVESARWSLQKRRAGVISMASMFVAACIYTWWSTRPPVFPEPSGFRSKSPPAENIQLPFLAPVSMLEYVLVGIDLALIAGAFAWLLYRCLLRLMKRH